MVDSISKKHRSWNMGRIKSKDTSPEKIVRSLLHKMGYRFRLHRKNLPGKPDIVLTKYKAVIEVRGCFWHRHKNCKETTTPKSNTEFWLEKFRKNVERDKKNKLKLKELGWKVIVIWECETKNKQEIVDMLKRINSVNPV